MTLSIVPSLWLLQQIGTNFFSITIDKRMFLLATHAHIIVTRSNNSRINTSYSKSIQEEEINKEEYKKEKPRSNRQYGLYTVEPQV